MSMYSAYEVCISPNCQCGHTNGVWRATGVTLIEAYRSLSRAVGYEGYVVTPYGEVGPYESRDLCSHPGV